MGLRDTDDDTSHLINRLFKVERAPLWWAKSDAISDLLQQIADKGQTAAIRAMPGFLLSDSPKVRAMAGRAIAHLLSLVPAEDLLALDDLSEWTCRWSLSGRRFEPATVRSLASDPTLRTPILGLVSFHRNGYVRHEAVRLLADARDGSELPYLLIRQNDWVEPISRDARTAVQERLVDENLVHFVKNMPLVVHLSAFKRRDHSAVVQRVVELLVRPRHRELLLSTLRSPNSKVRRWVARQTLDLVGEHQPFVVRLGVDSDDGVVRLWSCRLVRFQFASDEVKQILGKLKRDHFFRPVRSEAYWSEAQAFPDEAAEIWKEALFDSSYSIREMAQWQLAKMGKGDVAPLYREKFVRTPDSLPALIGLGGTGDQSDLPMIRRHLKAVLPKWRRAAVYGLAHIGGEAVTSELVECLRDDSRSVVREVRRRLEEPERVLDGKFLINREMEQANKLVPFSILPAIFEPTPSEVLDGGHSPPHQSPSSVEATRSATASSRIGA